MSHFCVGVLLDKVNSVDKSVLRERIESMLAPYDENVDGEEREVSCYCVGRAAQLEVGKQANVKFGTWDEMKDKFRVRAKEAGLNLDDVNVMFGEQATDLWNAEFRNPRVEWEDVEFEKHPGKELPDPACGTYDQSWWDDTRLAKDRPANVKLGDRFEDGSGCGGAGKVKTTSNPDAKWDWWEIGGRWADYPSFVTASELVQMIRDGKVEYTPFALLKPDGFWAEKGEMGWFGCVDNEKRKDDWKEESIAILEAHRDCLFVAVDCHV